VEGKQKQKSNLIWLWSFIVILIYIIPLNKLRFNQISCSGRGGSCWQGGVPICPSGTRS